nr:MAG TPA: Terminase small subunit [Caudoviricetes sp.]
MDIGLNQRQKIFASEYLRTGNAYQSAVLAGYSEAYAKGNVTKLLENESVKSFIQAKMDKMHDENIMSAKEALSILSDIARGKRDEEVLMMNPVTGEIDRVKKKADNATVIKAIQEILKRNPTTEQAEKLRLEIEKLKTQLETGNVTETNITIVDRWSEDD